MSSLDRISPRMRVALLLLLIPSLAAADASPPPAPAPRWQSSCLARFREAQLAAARRYPAFKRAQLTSGEGGVQISDGGDLTFTYYAAVEPTDRADTPSWQGDSFADFDLPAVPVDCPPDEPQFQNQRVYHGLRGVVRTDGAPPDVLRLFWRTFRAAVDDCLAGER